MAGTITQHDDGRAYGAVFARLPRHGRRLACEG